MCVCIHRLWSPASLCLSPYLWCFLCLWYSGTCDWGCRKGPSNHSRGDLCDPKRWGSGAWGHLCCDWRHQSPEQLGQCHHGLRHAFWAHLCPWSEFSRQPQIHLKFFQKIIMNLDGHKLNAKIQQLKIKLFA